MPTKVTRAFRACVNKEVYPRTFQVGDDVDGAALVVARKLGCVEQSGSEPAERKVTAPSETKAKGRRG